VQWERRQGLVSDLTCFRGAAAEDIQAYRKQYKSKYAAAQDAYLTAFKKCSVSNRDATDAPPTTSPPLLAFISRFERGFIAGLGVGRPSNSTIVHGFSLVDATAGPNLPSALELIYLLVGATPSASSPGDDTIGEWVVKQEKVEELESQLNEQFVKNRAAVRVKLSSYALERPDGSKVSSEGKLNVLRQLHAALAKNFEHEGLSEISASKIREKTGRTPEELLTEASKGVPFGNRGVVRFAPSFRVLVNEQPPACPRGDGAVVAYLYAVQPADEVQKDFGSVMVMVAGFGVCSRGTTALRTYKQGLIDGVSEELAAALRKR
jgi:hypothetical protein